MRTFSGQEQFEDMKSVVTDAYKKVFPVERNGFKLELKKIWVDDSGVNPNDFTSQKKAKLANQTWGAPVFASMELKDPSGKVIDRMDKVRFSTVPRITPRGAFIVGGNEYQIHNQLLRRPGVFVVRKAGGDQFKANFNLAGEGAKNFEMHFDPITSKFSTQMDGKKIPLYPLLHALGTTDKQLESAWGSEILAANKKEPGVETLKYAQTLARVQTPDVETARDALKAYIKTTRVDPHVTELTVGKKFEALHPELILGTSSKLLNVYRRKQEPDDPENLLFKHVLSVDDMLHDLLNSPRVQQGLKNTLTKKLGSKTNIKEIVDFHKLSGHVESFFTRDNRSNTPEQTNPMHMLSGLHKITIMGTGGITDPHQITTELREVHPSHVGFIDPVSTPESAKIGANLHLTAGIIKDGREIRTAVINAKTGKVEYLTPRELYAKKFAFPDAIDIKGHNLTFKSQQIKGQLEGKMQTFKPSEIDYVLPSHSTLFSHSTNLIPFLANDQGNRAMMGSKMIDQALSLVEREAPHVRTTMGNTDKTFVDSIGKQFSLQSPIDGIIKEITANHIRINNEKIPLYNHFPLNQKSFLHHEPTVKVGDKVKAGQLIADSNFSKNGKLALGKNLRVAYLPYPGLTFEDGLVITESAAKKLATPVMYQHNFKTEAGVYITDPKKYLAYFGNDISKEKLPQYGSDGVIKKGTVVDPGQILVMGLHYDLSSPDNLTLRRVNRALEQPWSKAAVKYTGEFPGVVTDVVKSGGEYKVMVKSIEPAREADKLSGSHGNKGVITKVIPDKDAPRDKEGKIPDVFMNPHGIISRINIGQIYESTAGKIAEKTGKPYQVTNFKSHNTAEKLSAELKQAGISDKEELFLPNGKSIGSVHVGNPYILRLAKTGKTGFSARMPGLGYDLNMQPIKGGEEGSKNLDLLTFYSMLSHGAKKNLIDAHQKSEKNDEYWHALEMGKPLPAPKPTFAFNKFLSMLHGAGINTMKNGSEISLAPMTDKDVAKLSNGKIKEPEFLYGKDLKPKVGGFFDPGITGGLFGNKYSHIELTEPLPNPIFENAVRALTGLKEQDYRNILAGKLHVTREGNTTEKETSQTLSGGKAIQHLLKQVDVTRDLQTTYKAIKNAKKEEDLDRLNKKARYLSALKELNLKPEEAYVRKNIPVIPPIHRPVYTLPDGVIQASGANLLYQNTGILNKSLEYPVMKYLPDSEKADLRNDLYSSTRAIAGLEDVLTRGREHPIRGFVSEIAGAGSPKGGFFISKVLTKRQDLVSRGVIIAAPDLDVDHLGVPEKMSWVIFRPFAIQEFIKSGFKPDQARKEMDAKTALAKKMLESAMKNRTVLLNRAPSLHRFSIMAFKPVMTDGLALKIPPLVLKGFGGDFDGDQQQNHIVIKLNKDACEAIKMILGSSYVEERNMTARFKEVVGIKQGDQIIVADLADFPAGSAVTTKNGTKGRIDLYEAIPGTEVLAFDESFGSVSWKPVKYWSKHYNREVEVVTLNSGRQIFTDSDPRAVYGIPAGSLALGRFTPEQAKDKTVLVPRARDIDCTDPEVKTVPYIKFGAALKEDENRTLKLDSDLGYLLGAFCGNGWADEARACLATSEESIAAKVLEILKLKGLTSSAANGYKFERDNSNNEGLGRSTKYTYGSISLSRFIGGQIGKGARNKHLPPCFLLAPKEFRLGLFAGLMDTDGSICVTKAKAKLNPQLMANYSTSSLRLAREIQLLALSLKIKAHITTTKTPAGEPFWALYFSNVDIANWKGIYMQHTEKLQKLHSIEVKENSTTAKLDILPISFSLAKHLRESLGAPRNASKEQKSIYGVIAKAAHDGFVSRQTITKVMAYVGPQTFLEHPDCKEWLKIYENKAITWDRVVSFERTGIKEDGYDLTVPGYETFMTVQGTILSNTMTVHVPTSEEAVRESVKMFPSQNLFKPGTGELMIQPSQESAIGLYFLSQNEKGREQINKILPSKYRVGGTLDRSAAKNLYNKLAKEEPQAFAGLVNKLKLLGDKTAYEKGFTVGLDDIVVSTKARDAVFKRADQKAADLTKAMKPGAERDAKISDLYQTATKEAYGHIRDELKSKGNSFYHMVTSGARGNDSQLMQIVSAPGIMKDSKDRPIPTPVKNSYAEGLNSSDYFLSMYGARKGMMDRALQTALPGDLSKTIMANVMDNIVTTQDCGTKKGIDVSTADKDATTRLFSQDQHGYKRNQVVTPQILSDLQKRGIKNVRVRSPLTCLAPKGTCAMCFGHDEFSQMPAVGENIGVKTGQTMAEPLTQSVMKTFHTGGIAGAGPSAVGFERISQLLKMPKELAGESTISELNGKISRIEKSPAGGFHVWVNDKKHTVRPALDLKVKVGDAVQAGEPLSQGVLKPQELVKYRGMAAAQNYIVDELQKAYQDQGVPMHRKIFETVVRSVGNATKVISAPKDAGVLPGDMMPYTEAVHYNETRKQEMPTHEALGHYLTESIGPVEALKELKENDLNHLKSLGYNKITVVKAPLIHAPMLKGVEQLPMIRKDWMSQLGYRYIKKALTEGAAQAWKTNVEGTHPVPAFASGTTFGRKKEHY